MSDEKKDTTAQDIKLGQKIGEDQEAQKAKEAEDKKPTEEKK